MVKEKAAEALAGIAEHIKEEFTPYFADSIQFFTNILNEYQAAEHKQFRGQVIDSITIICEAVGIETFRPIANDIIVLLKNI